MFDIALGAEPTNAAALAVKADTRRLLKESGATKLSETMWPKSELTAVETALGASTPNVV